MPKTTKTESKRKAQDPKSAANSPAGTSVRGIRDARRRLLRTMRSELLPVVEAIVGHTQILRNDVADRSDDMLQDLGKLLECTTGLYEFIKEDIRPTWPEVKTDAFDERLRRTRHDIGNQLNHALGYCQFLIMDEQEQFFGAFVGDLETIQRHCKNCEALLARYKSASVHESQSPGAEMVPLPAAEVVPHDSRLSNAVLIGPASILVVDDSPEHLRTTGKISETAGASGRHGGGRRISAVDAA